MTPPDEPKRSEEDIRSRSNALAALNDVKALAAFYRGGSREQNSADTEVAAVRVPILGIIGTLDNVRSMNQLTGILPPLQMMVIDGATHAGDRSLARRPEFVNAIREFVAAHPQLRNDVACIPPPLIDSSGQPLSQPHGPYCWCGVSA